MFGPAVVYPNHYQTMRYSIFLQGPKVAKPFPKLPLDKSAVSSLLCSFCLFLAKFYFQLFTFIRKIPLASNKYVNE